jgi:hypothetical protein
MKLDLEHPTAVAFLDETGAIANDRFFAVGCLKLVEPSELTRRLQKLRDRHHWYDEIHWVDLTRGALPFYRKVVNEAATCPGATFSCFIADRDHADPVERFGQPWSAYSALAAQLLIGSIRPTEIVFVLADAYSTPDDVSIEVEIRDRVNRRFSRLAVPSVCRLDSRSADPLQVVDLLTAAVAFEFRQQAGLAGATSPKARLMTHVRSAYGVSSFLNFPANGRVNVAKYGHAVEVGAAAVRRLPG